MLGTGETISGKIDFSSMKDLRKKKEPCLKKHLGHITPEQRKDLKTKTKQLEQLRKMRTDNIKRFAKNKTGKLVNLVFKTYLSSYLAACCLWQNNTRYCCSNGISLLYLSYSYPAFKAYQM